MSPKTKAYTTRKMPSELLDRMRVLAAWRTAETGQRVTLEHVFAEVLKRGLPLVEAEVIGRKK